MIGKEKNEKTVIRLENALKSGSQGLYLYSI